ncbi:MAG TPA: hypothetical protein VFJ58_02530, partial [Armatimonadota bacterium]|nr:hypothetical protein [Armatimonadota bacterium]
ATQSLTIPVDSTPPATTLSFSGPAGADSSSFTGPVEVKLSAADNLSGVSATYYSLDGGAQQTYIQPVTIAADGSHTIKYWSADLAGNVEAARTQTALVDTSLPSITITSPQNQAYLLNQVVNASYSAADTEDGVVSLTGTVPSGSPIDTASVGTKSFTVKASDTAGNSSQANVSYTVSYGVKLLYEPTIAAAPGQPLAILLQLVDASGANVSSASITVHAVSITGTGEPASAGTGTGPAFTFDSSLAHTGGYVFNLSTRDLPAGSLNLNFIAGNDPTVHQAPFTSAGPAATIPAGVSMVSVPFAKSGDLAGLFGVQVFPNGSADVATYDPISSQYLLYPHLPGSNGKSALPGRGYWVMENSPTKVRSSVSAKPSPLDISLSPGWNMIGDPYAAPLALSSLQVALSTTVGGIPANQFMSEQDAGAAGIVGATIWTYDTAAKQYAAADTLAPFVGYWIYIDPVASGGQAVTLRFTQPGYQVVLAGG